MSIDSILEKISAQANVISPIGSTVKFKLDDHVIFVDGTGESNEVSTEDKEAACVISTTMENFEKLKSGKLNPTMALMTGKVKIKGDMSIALKLQSMLS